MPRKVLLADLVIDASGARLTQPQRGWPRSGYARPDPEQVRIKRPAAPTPPDLPASDRCPQHGDLAILDAATPQLPRAGAAAALQGDPRGYGDAGRHSPLR